jgi:hypothetical protein
MADLPWSADNVSKAQNITEMNPGGHKLPQLVASCNPVYYILY